MENLTKFVNDPSMVDTYFNIFMDQNPPKEAMDFFQFQYEKNFSSGGNVLDNIRNNLGQMGYENIVRRADMEFEEYVENSLFGTNEDM